MQNPEVGADWSIEDITHYDSLAQPLLTYLCQHTANQQDAEELLLAVFIAALNDVDFSNLPPQRRLNWLRHVASNKLSNRYHHHKAPINLSGEHAVDPQDEQPTHAQVLLTTNEQEALVAHVRTRLQNYEDLPAMDARSQQRQPGKWTTHYRPLLLRGRFALIFNLLAAALVIAVIATGSLLLFKGQAAPQPQTQISAALTGYEFTNSPTSASYSIPTAKGKLDEAIQITPGSYFFGEIIAIDFTITNHTGVALYTLDKECPADYAIETPDFQATPIPVSAIGDGNPCAPLKLAPEGTFTLHNYLVLPTRGQVNLHAYANLHASAADDAQLTGIHNAQAVQGPMLPLQIANTAPPARVITLTQKLGSKHTLELLIHAPAAARTHLLYWTNMVCQDLQALKSSGELGRWRALTTTVIHQPPCLAAHQAWDYAIGAPGYAITQGKYQR